MFSMLRYTVEERRDIFTEVWVWADPRLSVTLVLQLTLGRSSSMLSGCQLSGLVLPCISYCYMTVQPIYFIVYEPEQTSTRLLLRPPLRVWSQCMGHRAWIDHEPLVTQDQ